MASTILRLTDKQHDVLYALSGCSDVSCTMSKVDKKVRGRAGTGMRRHWVASQRKKAAVHNIS